MHDATWRITNCSIQQLPSVVSCLPMRRHVTFKAAGPFNARAEHVMFRCASFLSWSILTHPAYRCQAWRRPSRRASPESGPWPSPWETSPPWAGLSYTPPVGSRGERKSAPLVSWRRRSCERAAHHFVVDLVEVDLAHFLHHVLVLERHEAKPWRAAEGVGVK